MNRQAVSQTPVWRTRSQVWDATGMWAWLLHRITGIGMVGYILLHVFLMGSAVRSGQTGFDSMLALLMGNPVLEVLDMLLLGAVFYHGFNGIRILLFDLGLWVDKRSQKVLFGVCLVLVGVLWFGAVLSKLR